MLTSRTLLMCLILLFFTNLCYGQQKKDAKKNFPLEQLTGNTDAVLIDKYRNVDTANFQGLERPFYIRHMPIRNNSPETLKKRAANFQKKRSKYPKTKINNINEVRQWLEEFYGSHNPCNHSCIVYALSHYKQVDDGFLIKGDYYCATDHGWGCVKKNWKMYLVGYDHNILWIKDWETDPCPKLSVEIHFPEFADTEIRYPELSGHNIDSFLLKNFSYDLGGYWYQGKVLVSFIVETDGSISNRKIESSTDILVNDAVNRCIKRTNGKWISGVKNGEKTPMEIKIEFIWKFPLD